MAKEQAPGWIVTVKTVESNTGFFSNPACQGDNGGFEKESCGSGVTYRMKEDVDEYDVESGQLKKDHG